MSDEIIDVADAMERVQDDQELLIELFDIFVEDFIAKRKELETFLTEGNHSEIKNLVHSLKGAAGNISALSIHRGCMLIEELCEEQKFQLIRELLVDLDQQFSELQDFVVRFKKENSA